MEHNKSYDTALERYLAEVENAVSLQPNEESALLARIEQGDSKAEERLTKAYLSRVVAIAKKYHVDGISFEDIINEGNIGLLTAIRKYKAECGVAFSSFASRHIRESITSALASRHLLVLKPSVGKTVRGKISRAIKLFQQKNERRPDISEIAQMVGMPEQQVMDIIHSSHIQRSMDAPVKRGGNVSLSDLMASQSEASSDYSTDKSRLRELMTKAASQLDERQRNVMTAYYGLDGMQLNMAEIAEKYGMKRERVRQIRNTAMRKLHKLLRDVDAELNE